MMMQSSLRTSAPVRSAHAHAPSRSAVVVRAAATPHSDDGAQSRRAVAAAILSVPALLGATAVIAKEAVEAPAPKNAAAERRAALRKAAADIKRTGEDKPAFADSSYAMPEDKSPNVHTRQEEGLRKSSQ